MGKWGCLFCLWWRDCKQIANVFDTLYLKRDFKIHCFFLKYLVEPFSKWSCSEINACKVWFKDVSNGVNNRSEEQLQQAETLVPWFKHRKNVRCLKQRRRICNELLVTEKLNVFYFVKSFIENRKLFIYSSICLRSHCFKKMILSNNWWIITLLTFSIWLMR